MRRTSIAHGSVPPRELWALLAWGWVLAGFGCAHEPTAPGVAAPERTVAAFARALEQGEPERAYALMSSEYRARVGLDAFRRAVAQHPNEALVLAGQLAQARGPARQEAELGYGAAEHVRLRREGDQWFIVTDLIDFYDQATPRAALRSFVRAVRAKRYDVVLRFVPEAEREGLSPEQLERSWSEEPREDLERVMAALQGQLDNPIEIAGERATMPYGSGLRAQLVREGLLWKIEDLE